MEIDNFKIEKIEMPLNFGTYWEVRDMDTDKVLGQWPTMEGAIAFAEGEVGRAI